MNYFGKNQPEKILPFYLFSLFLDFEPKICSLYSKMFIGVVKAELSVCIGTVSEKQFFRKKMIIFFSNFSENGRKLFGFCRKHFGEDVETAFQVSIGTNREKKWFFKNLRFSNSFRTLGKIFLAFCQNFSVGCQK